MNFMKSMVNLKVNSITTNDLLKYAGQVNMKLTRPQAEKIATYLRGKNLDIFDDNTRSKIIREVAKICGPETARELNKLFIQFTS